MCSKYFGPEEKIETEDERRDTITEVQTRKQEVRGEGKEGQLKGGGEGLGRAKHEQDIKSSTVS